MSEEEFAYALRKLRGEFTAPSEVAEVVATLFETQREENDRLRKRIEQLEEQLRQLSTNMQNSSNRSYW